MGSVGLPVETSDHIAVFMDVMLDQPMPHLLCRQEVNLKNSVDWKLGRGDVKVLSWNGIIMSPSPVSSLNEALLRVVRDII